MKLHESLRKLVADRSNKEIASELGVAEPTVSQWLNGTQPCGEPYLAQMVHRYSSADDAGKRAEMLHLLLLRFDETLPGESDKRWGDAFELAKSAISNRLEQTFQQAAA